MSVWASGSIDLDTNEVIPVELIDAVKEYGMRMSGQDTAYYIEFEGNWWLDDVCDTIDCLLKPYIKSGRISYWSDEGDARAEFCNGKWEEEWVQKYYSSDLPTADLSSTERVRNILNTIAEQLMDGSDSGEAVRILLGECKLTDEEVRLYGLGWLKDLA